MGKYKEWPRITCEEGFQWQNNIQLSEHHNPALLLPLDLAVLMIRHPYTFAINKKKKYSWTTNSFLKYMLVTTLRSQKERIEMIPLCHRQKYNTITSIFSISVYAYNAFPRYPCPKGLNLFCTSYKWTCMYMIILQFLCYPHTWICVHYCHDLLVKNDSTWTLFGVANVKESCPPSLNVVDITLVQPKSMS